MSKNVILIILDSVGIGELPDAAEFGDAGSDTLGHIINKVDLKIPNLEKLGMYNIKGTSFCKEGIDPIGSYGKCKEVTKAKDTTCGHWEIAGIIMDEPFKTYPKGFPDDLIKEFEAKIGRKVLGNCVASGTQIIDKLGDEHVKTGFPIVYTSADSVFQIAAHEKIIPLEQLYEFCQIARDMLNGENNVGRVIARPFLGTSGSYFRTENRKDYASPPPIKTVLDGIIDAGKNVCGIGKIEDIFCRQGINIVNHTKNNETGIEATIKAIKSNINGFVFSNLVDFDMLYGHRNDYKGYAKALEYFDSKLPEMMDALGDDDVLMISADHGCDPLFPGTDHTREHIPILVYGKNIKPGVDLGTRNSFADIGASVYDYLGLGKWSTGQSFMDLCLKK